MGIKTNNWFWDLIQNMVFDISTEALGLMRKGLNG